MVFIAVDLEYRHVGEDSSDAPHDRFAVDGDARFQYAPTVLSVEYQMVTAVVGGVGLFEEFHGWGFPPAGGGTAGTLHPRAEARGFDAERKNSRAILGGGFYLFKNY